MFQSHTSGRLATAAKYMMDEQNSIIACGRHEMDSDGSGANAKTITFIKKGGGKHGL